jgi:hypothetical protein
MSVSFLRWELKELRELKKTNPTANYRVQN